MEDPPPSSNSENPAPIEPPPPPNMEPCHCGGVATRLAALRDRIRANGTAVLPPSRAAMGPPFVPALDYLRRLVLDAAAADACLVTSLVTGGRGPKRRLASRDLP